VKVSIIGQGYVGLTIAVFAADHHTVVGFDKCQGVVDALNAGKSHIEGVESVDLTRLIEAKKYTATTEASDIAGSDVVVIAVPTPLTKDRKPDLTFVEAACKTIGDNLKTSALIINESTSFPGTVRNLIKPLIEKYSGGVVDHMYAVSPERVDPGRSDWNQKNTPRLYAGLTLEASRAVRDFYSTFCDQLVEVSSPEVAESAKLFENTFRQVNIALVTKPYGFMKFMPSAGVGGHCIPVDPSYLAHTAAGLGVPATFIERANEVNLEMAKYVVDRVKNDHGGSLAGKSVQVVGVAYKPNVADVRETPAELVIEELKKSGAAVTWSDDLVANWKGKSSTPLGSSDITVVVTLHAITDAQKVLKSAPYVFDTTGRVLGAHSL
jgi:UDP-N-acetyl-D-glucosamine dehydrogenase